MPISATAVASILALVLTKSAASGAPKADGASTGVNSICDEAKYDNLLAAKLAHEADTVTKGITTLLKAQISYEIAAAAAPTGRQKTAFQALEIMASAQAETAAKTNSALERKLTYAAMLLRMRVGKLKAVHDMKPQTVKQTGAAHTTGQSLNSANGMAKCSSTATLTGDTGNCTLDDDGQGTITSAKININEATQIKLMPEERLQLPKLTVTAYAKGTPDSANTAATNNGGFCVESSKDIKSVDPTNVVAATLTMTPQKSTAAAVDLHKSGHEGACADHPGDKHWQEHSQEALRRALCEVKTATPVGTTPPHKLGLTHLENSATLATILRSLETTSLQKAPQKGAYKAVIQQYIGKDANDFKTTIVAAVEEKSIDITLQDKHINSSPIKLAGTEDGLMVLSYYRGKELAEKKQAQDAATKPTVAKEVSDKCKTITDQEKCKTEDGCEVKGYNCVAAEGKVEEKNEDKCKWKPEKECKSPDCKLEGETCKDSSFILNKKLALMVSAFVAFPF
uniref:Variant surface glycoprotein 1125.1124 n=1 Tax=Trypanosoma brucei TaxID=5691 RepID=M4SX19_9TRYP|nr:variant surface glycoprotein 434 [Trypanosoma brucei]APD73384.1 variant surface glycoprotein 1125.1124 [Trypanosoma brucei]